MYRKRTTKQQRDDDREQFRVLFMKSKFTIAECAAAINRSARAVSYYLNLESDIEIPPHVMTAMKNAVKSKPKRGSVRDE